ncbi:MAG: hypothetical protein B7Z12_17275 [Caulobacter vibrioides]|uniref:Integrase n=1 Tax=Caulobacter vibrioides TaxID=155892 RepID=A0A258CWU4_CAUVI|nr:MAG: hypothetical protein B7Z12_17275 [Caulobacter vibrioides]
MATILKQKSGSWRVQVRRKGRYLSQTFGLRKDAKAWPPDRTRSPSSPQTIESRRFDERPGSRRGVLAS